MYNKNVDMELGWEASSQLARLTLHIDQQRDVNKPSDRHLSRVIFLTFGSISSNLKGGDRELFCVNNRESKVLLREKDASNLTYGVYVMEENVR